MGRLEQFQRTQSDIQYLKDNDWTREETLAMLNHSFDEILHTLVDTYGKSIDHIHKVYDISTATQD